MAAGSVVSVVEAMAGALLGETPGAVEAIGVVDEAPLATDVVDVSAPAIGVVAESPLAVKLEVTGAVDSVGNTTD